MGSLQDNQLAKASNLMNSPAWIFDTRSIVNAEDVKSAGLDSGVWVMETIFEDQFLRKWLIPKLVIIEYFYALQDSNLRPTA